MRLLYTRASGLRLKEFSGDVTVPYAILSHTWSHDEITLPDTERPDVEQFDGYQKIRYALDQAAKDGYDWLWVDTCCIDKSSSAELSEAINSMYYWYQQAAVCYAYLSDMENKDSGLQHSRWFKRGWTLQELLAPIDVEFYTASWEWVGDKITLGQLISVITGIDRGILNKTVPVTSASVAKRMSWASRRETTRVEDMAYCLLGIFSVNMPLLYGERERAFVRLQEEITKVTDDQTIFAWRDPDAWDLEERGMLATSPRFFSRSESFVPCHDPESREPYHMTNRGLKLEVRLCPVSSQRFPDSWSAILGCFDESRANELIAIHLCMTSESRVEYRRIGCAYLEFRTYQGTLTSIYVPQIRVHSVLHKMPLPADYYVILRSCITHDGLDAVVVAASETKIDHYPSKGFLFDLHAFQEDSEARKWCPDLPYRFFVGQSFANHLCVALHFHVKTEGKRSSGTDISCLIGMTANMQLGWHALLNPPDASVEAMVDSFRPFADSDDKQLLYRQGGNRRCFEVACHIIPRAESGLSNAFSVDFEFSSWKLDTTAKFTR